MKFKLLTPTAKAPTKGTDGSAGYDLYVDRISESKTDGYYTAKILHYGVSVEIPEGYVGFLFERSSLYKRGVSFLNGVGVIDSDYRGELMSPSYIHKGALGDYSQDPEDVIEGTRVAQLVVVPYLNTPVEIVEELSDTERGHKGFGSSGSK